MTETRIIPDAMRRRQVEAADPGTSVWVSANAGSGKTHALAQRVINLLLKGHDPAKILCITFTKAAAANMADRVFRTLARWTTCDDATLAKEIAATASGRSDAAQRRRARQLFARALETPGGLKVQTIHAFCTRLLHQFPFEANVAARFTVLDETVERQLLEHLTLQVMLAAAADPESRLGKALAGAIAAAADQTFVDVVHDAIGRRDAVAAWIERCGGVEAAVSELAGVLGIDPADSEAAICAECAREGIPCKDWPALADILAGGNNTDRAQARRLRRAAKAGWPGAVDDYLAVFLRAEDGSAKDDRYLMGKDLRKEHPAVFARLAAERDRAAACGPRLRAVRARDRTAALLAVAHEVIVRYRAEKDRRGALDYDDLIDRTLALLDRVSAAWVLYKLDLGIDHILVDEAQDTSPKQWEIIKRLASEFTAGAGARPQKRTIFAVSDHKQSIFSFQGAAPEKLVEVRRHFERAHKDAELGFLYRDFPFSFRSSAAVLAAVDQVFSREQAYGGFVADRVETRHEALPHAAPGLVEIWHPPVKAEKIEMPDAWTAPFDEPKETSPAVRLAERIARTVMQWKTAGHRLGDILILVRQRGPLFEAIIRALKNASLAVAGADRLVLTEHIAIMDLIALADALLLPQDDLALAAVLRSPLFGFSDDDLFEIAWNRGERSLREALARHPKPGNAAVAEQLDRLAARAVSESPFSFYAKLLGPDGGRKRILGRLGPEANDALDEFLSLALAYETRETPSLQGFAAWLREANAEVKRDMEMTRDEVRVMTVHGAKGLEAHTVILADTTSKPAGPRDPRLLSLGTESTAPPMVWATGSQNDVPVVQAARERARQAAHDEYRRLLYVALTRAAERLIVCGIEGVNRRPEGCWYDLVFDALESSCDRISAGADGEILRFRKSAEMVATTAPEETKVPEPAPTWLCRPQAPEAISVQKLTPSAHDEELPAAPAAGRRPRPQARARGSIVHRLIQSLPDIPPDRRAEAGRQHLARTARDFSEAERDAMLREVLALLDDAQFAPLFAAGNRAEVPIVGRIATDKGQTLSVFGQVDRLAVTADGVRIADFKTGRPASLEELPDDHPYLRQLAAYRAVLRAIYPDRVVRASLVWTETPALMEIPAARLDRAWQLLTSS
jgi:ATP-dependent helicase/nuclease subunit A